MHSHALLRLMQLVSPALPVGAFNFSQGLEYAAETGWVVDETTALAWIRGLATHSVGTLDLPLLHRMYLGWQADDASAVTRWSAMLVAARESMEARAEERHLGQALAKILSELQVEPARAWIAKDEATFAALFSLAGAHWDIGAEALLSGYVWTWLENQVLAAVKLIPLGQTAGQRLLDQLVRDVPATVSIALATRDDDICVSSPAQGMAVALHETQYSRLFRS